ncbi:Alpha/Beta hydrolase protein [Melanogaster broomeanus]|nr:Alpha/Beta hydrolase protein [Melanogaster broomeanus]
MKVLSLVPLVYFSTVLASILPEGQVVLGNIADGLLSPNNEFEKAAGKIHKWIDEKAFVQEYGLIYELVQHTHFSDYQLRITEPALCDPSVKQYSGYLDITDDKALVLLARNSPEDAPLVMWLNGGPGCSSSAGLLFELGPCRIADNGANITTNPYSWNTYANIIFLDQPINVGYSYSDDGSTVDTSPVAGKDVYAFMELFLSRFPQYAKQPFHIAAESYGGTYAPNIANVIYRENKKVPLTSTTNANNELVKINLASVILGNGMTDNYIQMASIPEYVCDGPYPIYDDPEGPQCRALRSKVPICQRLIKACYDYESRSTCVPAALYCNSQLYTPIRRGFESLIHYRRVKSYILSSLESGLNPYDARRACDPEEDGPLCYREIGWIETYLNDPAVKAALGVNPQQNFESCNMAVYEAFLLQGDSMHNTPLLLPEMVNDGVRLLVYAGNADTVCNYIGNERWLEVLETKFLDEFTSAPTEQWITLHSGKVAGTVRSAGDGAGNVTFVTVHEAGLVLFIYEELVLWTWFIRFLMIYGFVLAIAYGRLRSTGSGFGKFILFLAYVGANNYHNDMKVLSLVPLVYFSTVLASILPEGQVVLGDVADGVLSPSRVAGHELEKAAGKIHKWIDGKAFVQEHGLIYELVQHAYFSDYQLRITEPALCDPSVKQYSGYLDITDDKHLFFWFFEARNSPEDAPLVMWLNGADNGANTTTNPYSWNTHANIIFLDQPINVGYSYSDDGSTVNTSPVAGKDVPFHLAAESYGGTYAPNIASVIYNENKKVPLTSTTNANNELVKINLASVILGNGMTDNYIQMASIPDYLCDGPYPIYDDPEGPQCQALRSKVPTCQRLVKACYDYESRFTCVPAALYCNSQLYAPIQQSGLNPYDARRACDPEEDGPLCYQEMGWIETYLNDPAVKAALGVNPQQNFESCNMAVNQAFLLQGDSMHNTPLLLP